MYIIIHIRTYVVFESVASRFQYVLFFHFFSSFFGKCVLPAGHEVMDIDAVGSFNMATAAFEALRQSHFGGVVKLRHQAAKRFGSFGLLV